MNMIHWLAIIGLAIIAGLGAYAWILWRRVWRMQRQRDSLETKRNQRLAGDIQFLAQSILTGQCPYIEGSIRIKVLLDNYSGPRRTDLDAEVFETIYESTAHIPTHQDWKALSRAERSLHERHMETLERAHKDALDKAARQLSEGLA